MSAIAVKSLGDIGVTGTDTGTPGGKRGSCGVMFLPLFLWCVVQRKRHSQGWRGDERERILDMKWLEQIPRLCSSQRLLHACFLFLQHHHHQFGIGIRPMLLYVLYHFVIILLMGMDSQKDQIRSIRKDCKNPQCILRRGTHKYLMTSVTEVDRQQCLDGS